MENGKIILEKSGKFVSPLSWKQVSITALLLSGLSSYISCFICASSIFYVVSTNICVPLTLAFITNHIYSN